MSPLIFNSLALFVLNIALIILSFSLKRNSKTLIEYKMIMIKQSQELNLLTRQLERNNNLMESYKKTQTSKTWEIPKEPLKMPFAESGDNEDSFN